MAEVKQKLPKHIIAFEFNGFGGGIVLMNKNTSKCWWVPIGPIPYDLTNAVNNLTQNHGWSRDSYVGKQIVF